MYDYVVCLYGESMMTYVYTLYRLCFIRSTLRPVMYGAMELSSMRCGVLERVLTETTKTKMSGTVVKYC